MVLYVYGFFFYLRNNLLIACSPLSITTSVNSCQVDEHEKKLRDVNSYIKELQKNQANKVWMMNRAMYFTLSFSFMAS